MLHSLSERLTRRPRRAVCVCVCIPRQNVPSSGHRSPCPDLPQTASSEQVCPAISISASHGRHNSSSPPSPAYEAVDQLSEPMHLRSVSRTSSCASDMQRAPPPPSPQSLVATTPCSPPSLQKLCENADESADGIQEDTFTFDGGKHREVKIQLEQQTEEPGDSVFATVNSTTTTTTTTISRHCLLLPQLAAHMSSLRRHSDVGPPSPTQSVASLVSNEPSQPELVEASHMSSSSAFRPLTLSLSNVAGERRGLNVRKNALTDESQLQALRLPMLDRSLAAAFERNTRKRTNDKCKPKKQYSWLHISLRSDDLQDENFMHAADMISKWRHELNIQTEKQALTRLECKRQDGVCPFVIGTKDYELFRLFTRNNDSTTS